VVLAVAVAVCATVLLGAGSAAAVVHPAIVTCKQNEPILCSEENQVSLPKGGWGLLLGEAKNIRIEGTLALECASGKVVAKFSELHTNPIKAEITSLTFNECKPCTTVTSVGLPYAASLSMESEEGDYLVTMSGSKKLSGCPFGVTCKFGAKLELLVKNTESGIVLYAEKELFKLEEGSKIICGETGSWTGEYSTGEGHVVNSEGKVIETFTKGWLSLVP
jgi:hypothetical protein